MLTTSTPTSDIMPPAPSTPDLDNPKSTAEFDKALGARLRFVRKLRGLSQTDLANICGLTFQQIQKYESGGNRLPIARMMLISKNLGTSPTFLIGDDSGTIDPMLQAISDRADVAALIPKLLKLNRPGIVAVSSFLVVLDKLSEGK